VWLASSTASAGVRKVCSVSTGPKTSSLHDLAGGVDAGDQRGRVVAALRRQPAGAGLVHHRALGTGAVDEAGNAFALHGADQRAHVAGLVQRRADADACHAGLQLVGQPGRRAFVHQQPRSGAADLPLVEEDAVDQAFDGGVEVGVGNTMNGDLPPSSSAELLAAAGGELPDLAPDLGAAGEGDLGDAGVIDDRAAGRAIAVDDVDHAGRQAGLHAQLGEQQRRQRRLLGRLEHHGVAAGQRRRDLPGQHQQRKVPGHDLADHAQGPVVRPLALEQLRPAGMVIEVPHRERDVDVARLADRLAVVQGLQHREQPCMLLQAARQRVQHARAPMAAERLPGGQRRGGGLHRLVDLRGAGLRHLRQQRCRAPGWVAKWRAPRTQRPPMKWPKRRPWPSSQAWATASDSGAGP
jgi:hypothetical protein